MIVNKLNWISSTKASPDLLRRLDSDLSEFYSTFNQRRDYQNLNDDLHNVAHTPNKILADDLAKYVVTNGFQNILEVGCGSGKIYDRLQKLGFKGKYTGIEMADYVIQKNKVAYPEANWRVGSVYDVGQESNAYDCCFAFFVLEHLIYPEKGLTAMLDAVKPGGTLVLIFPDVRASGIVPSQKIGRQYGSGAKEKLKKGKVLDGIISFWEGKIMRSRLKRINDLYGDFVINYRPWCLDKECDYMTPDFDLIYLGSKVELEKWANSQGCQVRYPMGTEGIVSRNAYMAISKIAAD